MRFSNILISQKSRLSHNKQSLALCHSLMCSVLILLMAHNIILQPTTNHVLDFNKMWFLWIRQSNGLWRDEETDRASIGGNA